MNNSKPCFFLFILLLSILPEAALAQGQCPDGSSDQATWDKYAKTYWLPHFTAGGGTDYIQESYHRVDGDVPGNYRPVNGWTFRIILYNPDTTHGVSVRATWYDQNGKNLDLHAYTTDTVTGFAPRIGCEGDDGARQQGWSHELIFSLPDNNIRTGMVKVQVLPQPKDLSETLGQIPVPDVTIAETFQYKVNGQIVSQGSVMPVTPAKAFSFFFRKFDGTSFEAGETGVAIANPNQVPVTVRPIYYERSFIDARNESFPVTVTIPAYSQLSRFVSQLQVDSKKNFWGTMVVQSTSDLPIIVQPIETNGSGANFTISTMPAVPSLPGPTNYCGPNSMFGPCP